MSVRVRDKETGHEFEVGEREFAVNGHLYAQVVDGVEPEKPVRKKKKPAEAGESEDSE